MPKLNIVYKDDTPAKIPQPNNDVNVGLQKHQNDEERKIYLADLKDRYEKLMEALKKDIDTSHIKKGQTTYDYNDTIAVCCLTLGLSGSGKTSYCLQLIEDDPNKNKMIIYINNKYAPLDKMIAERYMRDKNTYIITTEHLTEDITKKILEYIMQYTKDKKEKPVIYLIVDNLCFDTDPNSLKFLIFCRHFHMKCFILVHALENGMSSNMAMLRKLITHFVLFKWKQIDNLSKIGLTRGERDLFDQKINKNKNKHIKFIFNKIGQDTYIE